MQPLNREQLIALADAANARLETAFRELEITEHIPHISVGMVRAVMDVVANEAPIITAIFERNPEPRPKSHAEPRTRPGGQLSTDELRDLTLSEIRRLAGPEKNKVSAATFDAAPKGYPAIRLPTAGACALRLKMKWTEVVQLALHGEGGEAAASANGFRADAGVAVD